MPLTLSRERGQRVTLRVKGREGEPDIEIDVSVSEIQGKRVKLTFYADPATVIIHRSELFDHPAPAPAAPDGRVQP